MALGCIDIGPQLMAGCGTALAQTVQAECTDIAAQKARDGSINRSATSAHRIFYLGMQLDRKDQGAAPNQACLPGRWGGRVCWRCR
jgi:hypothetical protein